MYDYRELMEGFRLFDWLMHKKHFYEHQKNPELNSSRGQGHILSILKREDHLSTKELSYRSGTRVSSLNEILSRLEKAGLITRAPSSEDRRIIINSLSEKGRECVPAELGADVFSVLSDQEAEELSRLLRKICSHLEENLSSIPDQEFEKMLDKRKKEFTCFLGRNEEKVSEEPLFIQTQVICLERKEDQ